MDRTKFECDGKYGYHGAIKNSGKYHIGLKAISNGINAPLVAPAWQNYGWKKALYLIPKRF